MNLNKLSIKKLIEFRRGSERVKSNFADKLKVPKVPKLDEGGGDYCISSMSGLSKAYRYNSNLIIKEKLEELLNKLEVTKHTTTEKMYQKNINILNKYEKFDFSIWRPKVNLNFISHKSSEPIIIKNIIFQATPHQIFSFGEHEALSIGAIRFVTWQKGFKPEDLGIFSEASYRYLSQHYAGKYRVDPRFCLTIDAANVLMVAYNQILEGEISPMLDSTVDTLNQYLE